jgi:hypothetical protein
MAAHNLAKRTSRRRIGSRLSRALLAAVATLAAIPVVASASFHEILIREVYAGGASNDSYVVLQAYSGGQNFVGGHSVTAYNASGGSLGTFTFGDKVNSGANQMTILVADTAFTTPTPDGVMEALNLSPAGGAVCWTGLDCVSWGAFTGTISPSPGTPALEGGIPMGMALRRTIAAGACVNRLDLGDDSNDSEADFTAQTPHPRNNASAIEEAPTCVAPQLPDTTINSGPDKPTNATSAGFAYSANPASGATFQCKLDTDPFEDCTPSPKNYAGPLDGDNSASGTTHKFQVKATNADGTDPSPAVWEWKVDTVKPTATIGSQPPDPSPGASAAFSFSANEAATFECQLAGPTPSALSACTSSKTYTALADGDYTFSVRAKDSAGNSGDFDTYEWTVDNSKVDTTDPLTTLLAKPPNPSTSPDASFTYESNEPGSAFECKLDGAAFAACPATGIVYSGLANGSHTFQVRAIDPSANVDESPAGYSWDVAVPSPITPPPVFSPSPVVPETTITSKPGAVTRDRTPTFRFRSSVAGARYSCKLDAAGFRPCASPYTTKKLGFGKHVLQVRAAAGGLEDPTPARSSFKIAKPKAKRG